MPAGTIMPPSAPKTGNAARRGRRQFAQHQFAFDLHADDEEEDRHQRVVHEVPERQLDLERPGPQRERQVEEVLVGVVQR